MSYMTYDTFSAEPYTEVLERHVLPCSVFFFFFRESLAYFTRQCKTMYCIHHSSMVLQKSPGAELACNPDISLIEIIWRIIKQKYSKEDPGQQLECNIRQKWDNILLPELQQLISSPLRPLQTLD